MRNDPRLLPPFRRTEASDVGLTDADVRRFAANGVIIKVGRGLYAGSDLALGQSDPVAELVRAKAMLRRYPTAVIGGRSGAVIHGLWLVHHVGPVQLYRPVGWHRETYEVTVHETVIPAHQVVMIEGAPVANAARSCVDAMVGAGPGEALALMDSALRLGVQRADLHAMVPRPEDWRHRLINLGDPRSESALESVSRWVIHSAGLPKPELQVTLRLGDGSRARVDFIWEQQRVVGEADGALKYDDDGLAMAAQEIRQEAVEDRGYRVIRWGWKEAVKDPRLLPNLLRGPLGA